MSGYFYQVAPLPPGPPHYTYVNAYPDAPFPQHGSGLTNTVQNYRYPGAVQPLRSGYKLSYLNAYPAVAFPQHIAADTNTVQNYLLPGAVQPQANQQAGGGQLKTLVVHPAYLINR